MGNAPTPVPLDSLRYRITGIAPAPGALGKIVRLDWFFVPEDGAEVKLLQDQIQVPPRAEDAEILEAVKARRAELAPTFEYEVPNPEANAAIVGSEG